MRLQTITVRGKYSDRFLKAVHQLSFLTNRLQYTLICNSYLVCPISPNVVSDINISSQQTNMSFRRSFECAYNSIGISTLGVSKLNKARIETGV